MAIIGLIICKSLKVFFQFHHMQIHISYEAAPKKLKYKYTYEERTDS